MRTELPTRATLWVIVASATLTVMAGAILGPVVPHIQDGLGVSESLAGLIITTHGAFIVLTSPLAGVLVDRFGPRRPFIGGLLLYAVGGGAGLVIDDFIPLLASRAVLGVGVAFVYTGVTVLIYELYEGRAMDRVLGYRTGANSVGGAVWPLVGGGLGTISWQLPFGVYLVALPLGLLALATIPPTGKEGRARRPSGPDGRSDGGLGPIVTGLRRRPALFLVYLLFFGANTFLYAIVVFYPQVLSGVGLTSSLSIGLYLTANGVAGGVSAAVYDRLRVRAGRHRLVLLALALWSVGFGTAVQARSPMALVLPVICFGSGLGLVFPSAYGWIEALAPRALQGQFSSYLAMAGYIGQFVSPLVFGVLIGPFGIRAVFAAAGLAAGVGFVALGIALRRSGPTRSAGS